MAAGSAGYNVFDPHRVGVIARTDVRFFEEVPGYPKLMGGRAPQVEATAEKHFFYLFPDTEDEPPTAVVPAAAVPPNMPAVVPPMPVPTAPAAPAPAIFSTTTSSRKLLRSPSLRLSCLTASLGSTMQEVEMQGRRRCKEGVRTHKWGSIADRVMARRRANFAQYGDIV